MNIIEYQQELLSGKKIYIWFEDGSSWLVHDIEDLIVTEKCATKIEIVDPSNLSADVISVAIIDADLIGRDRHRFPNLASEKISAYWKEKGARVDLVLSYDDLERYDYVYISKVFTDTPYPSWLKESEKIHLGGTGFYFDQAPDLPHEIEHHMPDYHLYDGWINKEITIKIRKQSISGLMVVSIV